MDRQNYINVNDFTSSVYTSTVGIQRGSVISPVLCNLYTCEKIRINKVQLTEIMNQQGSMVEIKGKHTEFADDTTKVNSDKSI